MSTIGFSPEAEDNKLGNMINIYFPMVSEGLAEYTLCRLFLRLWLLSNFGVLKARTNSDYLPVIFGGICHVSSAIQSGTFVPQVAACR